MSGTITLLGISGSLRKGSYNTATLRALAELMPAGARLDIIDIADIPLYNGDLDGDSKPPAVVRLKERITQVDGLVLATPEYNYSVSGVLKNVIDWVSRPAFASVLKGKPTAMVSASMAATGGVRAQQHLKVILAGCLTPIFLYGEVLVGAAQTRFTDGRLTDEGTRKFLTEFAAAFVAHVAAQRN
jgi:chromate reductase